jgi:hypothetical protein
MVGENLANILMDLDNISDTNSDSSDEEAHMREMLDLIVIVMNYRSKKPQGTSIVIGAAYINEQLEGNLTNCHDMF